MTAQPLASRRPATDPGAPTGRLATWLQDFALADVPARVRERAKCLMLDGIGCAIVGAQLPWSRKAVEIVTRVEGGGDHTVIGWDLKAHAPPAAALLNGTFIQGFKLATIIRRRRCTAHHSCCPRSSHVPATL